MKKMKKKSLLNEVRQLQKIAGILKENEGEGSLFDTLTDDPNFIAFSDNGDWEYTRFGLVDKDGKAYYVVLERSENDEDVYELSPGITAAKIVKDGVQKGYFEKINGSWYYEIELEEEIVNWLNSFKLVK